MMRYKFTFDENITEPGTNTQVCLHQYEGEAIIARMDGALSSPHDWKIEHIEIHGSRRAKNPNVWVSYTARLPDKYWLAEKITLWLHNHVQRTEIDREWNQHVDAQKRERAEVY